MKLLEAYPERGDARHAPPRTPAGSQFPHPHRSRVSGKKANKNPFFIRLFVRDRSEVSGNCPREHAQGGSRGGMESPDNDSDERWSRRHGATTRSSSQHSQPSAVANLCNIRRALHINKIKSWNFEVRWNRVFSRRHVLNLLRRANLLCGAKRSSLVSARVRKFVAPPPPPTPPATPGPPLPPPPVCLVARRVRARAAGEVLPQRAPTQRRGQLGVARWLYRRPVEQRLLVARVWTRLRFGMSGSPAPGKSRHVGP